VPQAHLRALPAGSGITSTFQEFAAERIKIANRFCTATIFSEASLKQFLKNACNLRFSKENLFYTAGDCVLGFGYLERENCLYYRK